MHTAKVSARIAQAQWLAQRRVAGSAVQGAAMTATMSTAIVDLSEPQRGKMIRQFFQHTIIGPCADIDPATTAQAPASVAPIHQKLSTASRALVLAHPHLEISQITLIQIAKVLRLVDPLRLNPCSEPRQVRALRSQGKRSPSSPSMLINQAILVSRRARSSPL